MTTLYLASFTCAYMSIPEAQTYIVWRTSYYGEDNWKDTASEISC